MPTLVLLVHRNADCLLQVVADVPLAHRTAFGEVHRGNLLGVGFVPISERILDDANLRAVPMSDDNLIPLLDDLQKNRGRASDAFNLFFRAVAQGIAAEGYHYAIVQVVCAHETPIFG